MFLHLRSTLTATLCYIPNKLFQKFDNSFSVARSQVRSNFLKHATGVKDSILVNLYYIHWIIEN